MKKILLLLCLLATDRAFAQCGSAGTPVKLNGITVCAPRMSPTFSGNVTIGATLPAGAPTGTMGAAVVYSPNQGLNVRAFGAKGDTVRVSDGAITNGQATLTSATAGFTAASVGKQAFVKGAGAAGADLMTTVAAYVNATTVTLAANAGTTVTNASIGIGTSDCTAIQSAITAAQNAGGGSVYVPAGVYFLPPTCMLTITASNVSLYGDKGRAIVYVPYTQDFTVGTTDEAYIRVANDSASISGGAIRGLTFVGEHGVSTNTTTEPKHIIEIGPASTSYCTNDWEVSGNTFRTMATALGVKGGSDNPGSSSVQCRGLSIERNDFSDLSWGAITVWSGGPSGMRIRGNHFYNVNGLAIEFSGMGSVITDNTCENVYAGCIAGVSTSTQTGWTVISDNSIKTSGQGKNGGPVAPAIALGESTSMQRIKVTGNTIYGSYAQCISSAGSGVASLYISDNVCDGFGVDGDGKTLAVATGWTGIGVYNGSTVVVRNNLVRCWNGATDKCDQGITTGGSSGNTTYSDGNLTIGTYSVLPVIASLSAGQNGSGTKNWVGDNVDLATGKIQLGTNNANNEQISYLTTNSTTPTVSGSTIWYAANSNPTAITNLLAPSAGQIVTLICTDADTNTSLSGSNFVLRGSFACVGLFDSITLRWDNGNAKWIEIGRNKEAIVAKADQTGLTANSGSATLYAVPAGAAGIYRVSCYIVLTRAATSSSTLPNCQVGWTDFDSNTAVAGNWTGTNTGNTLGAWGGPNSSTNATIIKAKASTNITWATSGYASSGATSMEYAVHLRVEYLGQ